MKALARRARCRWAPAVALLLTAACRHGGVPAVRAERSATPAGGVVRSWVTTPDRTRLLAPQEDIALRATAPDAPGSVAPDAADVARIDVDPSQRYQTIAGFGAALTDASAWLLQHRQTPAQRDALLRELYSTEVGAGFALVRVTIGASDFSRSHYTFDDAPPAGRDDSLKHFSIAPHRAEVLPILREIRAINPSLVVMATPWSAPAWMKSTRSLYKGTLREDAYPAFAAYLARAVQAYAAEGVPIGLLSVQNEPHFEPDNYPGMRLEARQRAALIGEHLGPRFAKEGIATRILDWDHNWDAPESPLGVLGDSTARRYVSGVAWHCYGGDVAAQSRVHNAYPDKDTWFTECSGGAWAPNFGDNLRWNVRTLVIGTIRNWARGVMLWNLALDQGHGPHAGGCGDCRAVVTIDSLTGGVTRNEEFYALAHAARFVRPGARRIASTSGVRDVETVAFENPDRSLVLLAVNLSDTPRRLALAVQGRRGMLQLPAGSVATYTWR